MHLDQPFLSRGTARGFHHSEQVFPDWADAAKAERARLKTFQAVGAEVLAIDEGRHALQFLHPESAAVRSAEDKAWPEGLLAKDFEQSRHFVQTQRINDHQMIGAEDGFSAWRPRAQ